MSDPIGSARKKYRKRVEEAKKKAIGQLRYIELGTVRRGEVIRLRIPVVHLPYIRYGPWAPGIGSGAGREGDKIFPDEEGAGRKAGRGAAEAIYEDITIKDLVNWMKNELELETIVPGKRKKEVEKITYPAISSRGSESLLDLDETLDAMVERQLVSGELNPGDELHVKIDEVDLRYKFPKIKHKLYKDALVIYIRDVSQSVTPADLEASYILTFLIDAWLKEFYPKVERVYIAHNDFAWEEMEENYYRLQSSGGTSYVPAYIILEAMMNGQDYERRTQVKRRIDKGDTDIYVVQMTDGENWDHEMALSRLAKLMPNLTRFCYLETHLYEEVDSKYLTALKNMYMPAVKEGKVRLCAINERDALWKAIKEFFGKKAG